MRALKTPPRFWGASMRAEMQTWMVLVLLLPGISGKMITWLDSINGSVNFDYVNGTAWATYGKDKSDYGFNLEGRILNDIKDNVFVHAKYLWAPLGKKEEMTKVLEHFIDVCKMFNKKNGRAVFINIFVEFLSKSGKIPMGCPVKKGFYYFHNMSINTIPNFPMTNFFLKDRDVIFDVDFLIKVQKKLISIFRVLLYGGFKIV